MGPGALCIRKLHDEILSVGFLKSYGRDYEWVAIARW
jgi:hypothetical protein